jgi:hypothetical protein
VIVYPDLETCTLGVLHRFGAPPAVCYDLQAVLQLYQERDGMSEEEALEHFEFNVLGGWVGGTTPVFLDREPDWALLAELEGDEKKVA